MPHLQTHDDTACRAVHVTEVCILFQLCLDGSGDVRHHVRRQLQVLRHDGCKGLGLWRMIRYLRVMRVIIILVILIVILIVIVVICFEMKKGERKKQIETVTGKGGRKRITSPTGMHTKHTQNTKHTFTVVSWKFHVNCSLIL